MQFKRIKEVGRVYSGTTPATKDESNWNGEIKWLTPAELNTESFYITNTERKITEAARVKKSIPLLPPKTILLTSRAPIGKVAISGEELCTNQGFKNIVCNEEIIIPEYLYFWLSSKADYLNSLGRGATFKEISKKIVEEIVIPLPSIEAQKQIVSSLVEVRNIINLRQSQIRAFDELAQSIFLDMFGNPKLNKNHWPLLKLENICTKITDGTHDTPKKYDKGILLVTGKNIKPFRIDLTLKEYVSEKDHKIIYSRCNPEKGDILYTNIGVNMGTAVVNNLDYDFSMKNVALFKLKPEIINSLYLEYYLNLNTVKSDILLTSSSGGAQKFLGLNNLKKYKVVIPPTELQLQFSEKMLKIKKQHKILSSSLKELNSLYNALLQKSFRGELF